MWRGDAFGEFLEVEACEAEARRLEEMRLAVTEDRIDADLAAGAAAGLVAELESLVACHEFRERLWAQLMLALYRSGRQHDALAAYRRARGTLVEQLGIEPGRQLRALEAAVLEQDPALDLAAAGSSRFGLPALLESVGPAFVGRDAELARLRSAWLDAADGRGGFVSVLGPEGIGKTRLVAELAREVQRAGGVVVYGRCGEGGSGSEPCSTASCMAPPPPGTSRSRSRRPNAARPSCSCWPPSSAAALVLMIVDDAHLADHDTVELLADVAGWSAAGALLVVATFRTEPEMPAGPLPMAATWAPRWSCVVSIAPVAACL